MAVVAFATAACSSATLPPILGGTPPSSSARARITPRNGLEVVGAMRRMYPSRALKSLSYTVTIQATEQNGEDRSSRMHVRLPGLFRESELPARQRKGYVRDRHRLAFFERGQRIGLVNRFDLTTLLAYDVFAQSIDSTIMWLDAARVRFGVARESELDGRPVWIVGAEKGDTTSAQFWVDAERWIVLRVIQRDPRSPARVMDVRFTEFRDELNVPVPMKVDVYRNGRLVERRVTSDLVVNPSIPTRVFDLTRWRDVR